MPRRLIVLHRRVEKANCTGLWAVSQHYSSPPTDPPAVTSLLYLCPVAAFGIALPAPDVLLFCPFSSFLLFPRIPSRTAIAMPWSSLTRTSCAVLPHRFLPPLLPLSPALSCCIPNPRVYGLVAPCLLASDFYVRAKGDQSTSKAHVHVHLGVYHKSHAFTRVSNVAPRSSSGTLSE